MPGSFIADGWEMTPWSEVEDNDVMADEVIGVVTDLVDASEVERSLACAWNSCPFWGDGVLPRPDVWGTPKLNGELELELIELEAYVDEELLKRASEPSCRLDLFRACAAFGVEFVVVAAAAGALVLAVCAVA